MRYNVLKILARNKYISRVDITTEEGKSYLDIELFPAKTMKHIPQFRAISRPGQRLYI
jgi:ribosomal protein S8